MLENMTVVSLRLSLPFYVKIKFCAACKHECKTFFDVLVFTYDDPAHECIFVSVLPYFSVLLPPIV